MTDDTSTAAMTDLANAALASLPAQIRAQAEDVVISVEDFATQDQLASVGLVDRWTLSGLYQGRPLPSQSVWDSGDMPARVWLFRMPIIAEMRSRRIPIAELVHHVVVHELGHHFGFSDADMHALEKAAPR